MLTIDGTDVRIAEPTDYSHEEWGDIGRAFSGKMRSDIRADHRIIRVTTVEMTDSELSTLLGVLRGTPPLTCSGTLVGSPSADFHVVRGSIRVVPLTATDYVVSFALEETDDAP